jgi:predicted RNase H-like nuclease
VAAEDFSVIGIDMPMGLPDGEARQCEPAARRLISPRGSTIFPTPSRACLDARDYADACAISRAATGKAISKQAWHILPKIRELDTALSVADHERVIEVHPECSFAAMNGGRVLPSKRTADGLAQRRALTTTHFGPTPSALAGARIDDILDAYAVLWTAERFARGLHLEIPDRRQHDSRGIPMRIVV